MLLISLSTAPSHSAPHIKANERATESFYFTQKTNRVRKSSDHQPKSLSPMHVSMNGMKLRCKVSEWEVRYNDCIQPALLRTGFPAPAAGVMAWCKLLAITGLPSDHHPWPGSSLHGVLVVDVYNVNPLLSSTPATADTRDVMPGRGNRHTAFIYWSYTMPFFLLSYSPRLEFFIHWVELDYD